MVENANIDSDPTCCGNACVSNTPIAAVTCSRASLVDVEGLPVAVSSTLVFENAAMKISKALYITWNWFAGRGEVAIFDKIFSVKVLNPVKFTFLSLIR